MVSTGNKKTIDLISSTGVIVEVNTRGLYLNKSLTPYPSPWILELLHQKNVPVTLSSDAHDPADLVNRFPEIAMMLKKIGFKTLTVFKEGVWTSCGYDENGIIP